MRIIYITIMVLIFYLWLAGSDTFNFHMDHGGAGKYISYNHLTEAFMKGQLHLLREPDPELLKLSNPYNPWDNKGLRWHDASLYKGKYYLYFGATPVILFYLPFKLLTGLTMTDRLVSLIFMFGTYLWAVAILLFIQRKYFPNIEEWKVLLSVAVLGMANWGPFMVREDNGVYNAAILCGLFFLIGAIYLFIKSVYEEKNRILMLALGSLFVGLACGARPTIFAISLLLFPVLWSKINKDIKPKDKVKSLLALTFPFFACASLVALYNYSRFGNIFEFGFTYQVGLYDFNKDRQFNLVNLFITPFYYFFNLPAINSVFPYIHNDGPFIMYPIAVQAECFFNKEPTVGMFSTVPFLLLPLFYLFCKSVTKAPTSKGDFVFPSFEIKLIFIPFIINLILMFLIPGIYMRYVSEVITFFLLISISFWYYLDLKFNFGNKAKVFLERTAILLATISIVFWSALGIDELKTRTRIDFFLLKQMFKPFSELFLDKETEWVNIVANVVSIPVTLQFSDSIISDGELKAAIDGDVFSTWITSGNKTVSIEVIPKRTSIIKSIWLLSRQTYLHESWENLNVLFYLNGTLSSEMTFSFPDTYKKRIQRAKFNPIPTDKMILTFSKPVTVDRWGHSVPPESVNPGYSEIILEEGKLN